MNGKVNINVSLIFGTRPEAIKLCSLALAFREHTDFTPYVCVTAQHREMLDQVLEVFVVVPDVDLALIEPNQTLAKLTSKAVAAVDSYLVGYKNRKDKLFRQKGMFFLLDRNSNGDPYFSFFFLGRQQPGDASSWELSRDQAE